MLQIACKALESDAATLDLVLTMMGHLYHHCNQIADAQVRQLMTAALEDRWQSYDQRIYLLAYILNPARRQKHLNSTCEFVSVTNISCLLEDVYGELFGEVPHSLTDQFIDYIQGNDKPFTQREFCLKSLSQFLSHLEFAAFLVEMP